MSQCGINAVYSCMCYFCMEIPLDQVYSDIPRTENNQVNLYQLAQYARSCGLYVKPIKYPTLPVLKKYLTSNSSAILQFNYPNGEGHIVALLRPENDEIWIFDVPLAKSVASDELLGDLLEHSEGMLILSQLAFERSIFGRMNTWGRIWALVALASLCVFAGTMVSCIIKRERRK